MWKSKEQHCSRECSRGDRATCCGSLKYWQDGHFNCRLCNVFGDDLKYMLLTAITSDTISKYLGIFFKGEVLTGKPVTATPGPLQFIF